MYISKQLLKQAYLHDKNSTRKIAKKLKIAPSTVWRYLKKYKIKVREPKIKENKLTKKILYDLYIKKKLSIYQIGKILSWSGTGIWQKLKKYNILTRTISETRRRKEKPKCIDCGKVLKDYRSKRCQSCANKNENNPRFGIKEDMIHKEKRMKKIIKANKLNWKNLEYREKMLNILFKSRQIKPNKPEKLLTKLFNKVLPNEYKYVGDGKVVLGGFNPDFINVNGQKKIIELYGDYWHNLESWKERDKRRLIAYNRYGYKTLIIWEHELKNLNKVKNRIKEFNTNV